MRKNFITVMKRVNNKLKRKFTTNLDTFCKYLKDSGKESDKGGISGIIRTDEEEVPAKRIKMETSTTLNYRSVPLASGGPWTGHWEYY